MSEQYLKFESKKIIIIEGKKGLGTSGIGIGVCVSIKYSQRDRLFIKVSAICIHPLRFIFLYTGVWEQEQKLLFDSLFFFFCRFVF